MFHFDDVLIHLLGEFGTYQKRCSFLIFLAIIPSGMNLFSVVFIMADTASWCKLPEPSTEWCGNLSTTACTEMVKNLTIPKETVFDGCDMVETYSQCYRYDVNYDNISLPADISNSSKVKCDNGYDYDTSQYESTLRQQFDLVCDKAILVSVALSLFLVGVLLGSVVIGIVVDRFGRRTLIVVCGVISSIFGIAASFSPNFIAFCMLRILGGFWGIGVWIGGFVYVTELVGPSKRVLVGMINSASFGVGYLLMVLLAYFIREWWLLQLIVSLPGILSFTYWWVLAESPRWLISVGKMEEAEEIIRSMGRVNGVELPEKISDQSWNPRKQDADKVHSNGGADDDSQHRVWDLFRLPSMRMIHLTLCINWFVNTLVYTGISLNTSNLGGNDYISAAISATVEIPAAVLTFFLVESPRLGRRRSIVVMMAFGGCACLVTLFMPTCGNVVWAGILILLLGKMSIVMAYNTMIVYANELYPTPLRSSGIGMCTMVGHVGGILSPQFLELQRVWAPLTLLIFGVLSVIAGILILPLPETRGQNLPETIMEGENFGRKHKPNGSGDEQTKDEHQLQTPPSNANLIVEQENVLQGLDNAI
ncbi:organic cation transporter protein-like [Ptychodera flava]|uniref:organic cation transporter protein-like n=1 Tax=Ptychodera flava TaxID=63121 RepID=UPI00396AA243